MGLSSKPMRSIFSGEVKIEGDMQTGRKFQELFANWTLIWNSNWPVTQVTA